MIALLYDVHGNLPALEAALADAAARGATGYVLGGDYTLFGAWPVETLARLRTLDAEWIRGNGERWTARPDEAPDVVQGAIAACREALGKAEVAALAALPDQTVREGVRFCHASPLSDVDGFPARAGDDDRRLLDGAAERLVVVGHTHLQFARPSAAGQQLLNPGSVGMPCDGDHRAAYALLGPDLAIEPRRAGYDWRASAAAVRERLGPAGEVAARRIEAASFEV